MAGLLVVELVLAGAYFAVHSMDWEPTLHRLSASRVSSHALPQGASAHYPVRIEFAAMPLAINKATILTLPSGEASTELAVDAAPSDVATPPAPPMTDPGLRAQFANAFRNLGMPIAPSRPANPPAAAGSGSRFIPVNFSLDRVRASGDVIEVRKPVKTNGKVGGVVSLRIVGDTTVLVKSSELAGVFGEGQTKARIVSLGAKAESNGFVDFDALRDAGIDVRYDAARDQVVVETKKS